MRAASSRPSGHPAPHHGAARPWAVLSLCVLILAISGWLALRWYWQRSTLSWVVQRGLTILAGTNNAAAAAGALDQWEHETGPQWRDRRDELIHHLFTKRPLSDPRVRTLLTRISGADFGDRQDEWKRWFDTYERLQRGEQPKVPARQRIDLTERWKAPIGLTAWFSTILPMDRQIYVASLGASFEDAQDNADGIVCVDGKTGQARLLFTPPDGPLRDVLGIAAGDATLFAACRSGFVYCVDPEGTLHWKAKVGTAIGGPPLSLDLNRDGVTDVVVATTDARVFAFNGANGNTLWTSPPGRATPARRDPGRALGATLAAGTLLDDSHPDILVAWPGGELRVLAARNGEQRWKGALADGCLAGPVVSAALRGGGPPAYAADRNARIWSLVRSGSTLRAARTWELATRAGDGIVAAPRTMLLDGQPPALIVCPTGSYASPYAAVCLVEPEGVRWRYAPGGTIWATPALADLNGDRETELVLSSIESSASGQAAGVLTILSAQGQCLRRLMLTAPLESSPVVVDLDGDDRLELLVADQAGWLHCFETGRVGAVEWGLLGGDSHNTRNAENAYRYGQVRAGMQWRWRPD